MVIGEPKKFDPMDFFPFDGILALTNIDEELLIKAIQEKEKQKREYVAAADKTISKILKELESRHKHKAKKTNKI